MKPLTETKEPTSNETLITERQIADRWKCSAMTVRRRARAGILKPMKLGRMTRYRLSNVLEVEKQATVN